MATRREAGFTLIEVVVAFALLCVVLGVAFEIFSTGFARAADLDDRSRALLVAQSHLAQTGFDGALKEGDTHGETDDRRFQWTVSVRKIEDSPDTSAPPSIYPMFRIDVRVSWRAGDTRERTLSLATATLGSRQ